MAILQADLIQKRARVNTTNDSFNQEFTATYVYAAGAQVTSGDVIQLMDISALHTVVAIRVFTDDLDDGTTLTSNWGYSQIAPGIGRYGGVNASGVATDFDVASGVTYASPATNATYFQSANAVVGRAPGWSSLVLANTADPTGPGGPIRATLTWGVTPTQTTASAVQRVIRAQILIARATPLPTTGLAVDLGGY